MEEIWKDIEGFVGSYQVSNTGKVRSLDRVVVNRLGREQRRNGIILKQFLDGCKYHMVDLRVNGKKGSTKVHKLVAIHYVDNPDNKPQINHIDGIKSNNDFSNLEWCTCQENIRHAFDNNLNRVNKGDGNVKNVPIVQYDLDGNFIKEWISAAEASRFVKIKASNISGVCAGKGRTSAGFKWKYKTNL